MRSSWWKKPPKWNQYIICVPWWLCWLKIGGTRDNQFHCLNLQTKWDEEIGQRNCTKRMLVMGLYKFHEIIIVILNWVVVFGWTFFGKPLYESVFGACPYGCDKNCVLVVRNAAVIFLENIWHTQCVFLVSIEIMVAILEFVPLRFAKRKFLPKVIWHHGKQIEFSMQNKPTHRAVETIGMHWSLTHVKSIENNHIAYCYTEDGNDFAEGIHHWVRICRYIGVCVIFSW